MNNLSLQLHHYFSDRRALLIWQNYIMLFITYLCKLVHWKGCDLFSGLKWDSLHLQRSILPPNICPIKIWKIELTFLFKTFFTSWLVYRTQPSICLHITPWLSIFHASLKICNFFSEGRNKKIQKLRSFCSNQILQKGLNHHLPASSQSSLWAHQ